MGMRIDLRMCKVLQATISSSGFISIPTNTKFTKALKYIHDNKSWERCYVLLKIHFTCPRVLRLADSNLAGMDKFYYYSRMIEQCIEKTESDLDYQIFSLTYRHQPIYRTCMMKKVMKKSQYQMILPCILKIFVLSYLACGMKGRNISILIMM